MGVFSLEQGFPKGQDCSGGWDHLGVCVCALSVKQIAEGGGGLEM